MTVLVTNITTVRVVVVVILVTMALKGNPKSQCDAGYCDRLYNEYYRYSCVGYGYANAPEYLGLRKFSDLFINLVYIIVIIDIGIYSELAT